MDRLANKGKRTTNTVNKQTEEVEEKIYRGSDGVLYANALLLTLVGVGLPLVVYYLDIAISSKVIIIIGCFGLGIGFISLMIVLYQLLTSDE